MKIKDICVGITDGSHNPPQGITESKYVMLSSKNIYDNQITFENPRFLSEVDFEKENKRTRIVPGDVLLTIVGTVGRTAVVTENMPKFTLQRSVAVLHPKKDVCDSKYLMYALQSKRSYIESRAKGVAQKGIYLKEVAEIDLKIVPIKEQYTLIDELDRISAIIQLRKQELQKLDDLIKARFVELFGDVRSNSLNWDYCIVNDVIASSESGWSGNGKQRDKQPGEIAVLKVSAVTKGYFIPEECKVLDDQENIKKYVYPEKGDLIFSRANTREMVGSTAVIEADFPELILPDKLWKIKINDRANVYYIKGVLTTPYIREVMSSLSTGTSGSMYNLSFEKFKGIRIMLPPVEIQNQFADFVKQVDKSKVAVQAALDKAQLLFDSLMQEYFG